MNAKTAKKIRTREILRNRRRGLEGLHTMSGHCLAAGIDTATVSGVGSALHSKAKSLCLDSTLSRTRKSVEGRLKVCRTVNRYTEAQFQTALSAYRPRKPEYRAAVAQLLGA